MMNRLRSSPPYTDTAFSPARSATSMSDTGHTGVSYARVGLSTQRAQRTNAETAENKMKWTILKSDLCGLCAFLCGLCVVAPSA